MAQNGVEGAVVEREGGGVPLAPADVGSFATGNGQHGFVEIDADHVGRSDTVGRGAGDDLFVDPDWMRRGIGQALVLDVVGFARDCGVGRISVTANDHALGFYERAGFVAHGVVETRFGTAPRMHCEVLPDA